MNELKICKLIMKIAAILAGVFAALTALSMAVYFFNLDMKAAALAQPLVNKIYNFRKREPLP